VSYFQLSTKNFEPLFVINLEKYVSTKYKSRKKAKHMKNIKV